MGIDGLSSSVVIALAAVLWLVYLVPTWLRRREYLATERNAVRLQQTLRIMAETAEVPEQVRAETSARNVAVQEKILQREMQRSQAIARAQDAAAARAAARQIAETQPSIAASIAPSSLASRRLRRSRGLSSLVLAGALTAVGFGIAEVVVGGMAVLLIAGCVVAFGAVVLLGQISQVNRTRTQLAQTLQPARRAEVFDAHVPRQAKPVRSSWTPVPVPKPLYLSRSQIQAAVGAPFADATTELQAAAAQAERALRAAHLHADQLQAGQLLPQGAPIDRPVPAAVALASVARASVARADNRFARMGIIEVDETAAPDLDDVLRRRRAV